MKQLALLALLVSTSVYAQEAEKKKVEKEIVLPQAENELWLFAEGLYGRTWYKDALIEYEAYVQKFPNSQLIQNARWRIYECYEKLGNKLEKFSALDAYMKHEKNPIHKERARMNIARLHFEDNKFDEALKIYQSVNKKLDGGSLWESAQYESARIYLKQAKSGEAFLRFRHLAKLEYKGKSETRAYAIFAYASLLSDREKYDDAIKQFSRLTIQKTTVPELAENAWYNQGMLYFKFNKKNEAKKSFESIVQNFPNGRFKETAINQAARCDLGLGRPLEALQILKMNENTSGAIKIENSYLTAFANQQLKEYDNAIYFYNVVINDAGEDFKEESWFNKLNCLSAAGKTKEALSHAKLMVKFYPDTTYMPDVCYTAGLDAEKLKDFASAETFLRKALKSIVGDWSYTDSAYFSLARVLEVQKKFSDAAEVWQELTLRKKSEYRDSAYIRGAEAWMLADKNVKALELLKKYLKLFPNGNDAFFVKNRIVEILLLDEQFEEAVVFLKYMLKKKVSQSEKAVLQSVLGRVFYYQENYAESVKILQECLKTEKLADGIRSDCLVFLGFSKISLEKESEGTKDLALVFADRKDFSSLLSLEEELMVANLLEKYKYQKAAANIYKRLAKATDKKHKMAGLMGTARLNVVSKKYEEGLSSLKEALQLCGDEDNFERVEALSVMGEIYSAQNKKDQAFQTFEFALKIKSGSEEALCRTLYGMALILKERKDYDESRRYANQVFILYKDPAYAPKAMFLSIQASVLSKKQKEASQIANELKKKFPVYFAKIEVQDYLKENKVTTD